MHLERPDYQVKGHLSGYFFAFQAMETGPMPISSLLLAAGRGTRLRPLTDRIAKPALPLLDLPLGAFGLTALLRDCPPVAVNVSHLPNTVAGALRELLGEGGFELLIEPEPLGSGGTVGDLRGRVDTRLVTYNADLLTDLSVTALMEAHQRAGAPVTAAVALVDGGADLELEGGRATSFVDRRKHPDRAGARFLGASVIERGALDSIPDKRPVDLAEGLLRPVAERGELAAFVHDSYALDVGTPRSYLQASIDLLSGEVPRPPVPLPGEIVEVDEGRAYVGPGASVPPDALGPEAIVLRGASIGEGARVERALVWPHELVPSGERVVDAIWALGTSFSTLVNGR
jgi:mannose-1-phosphate guanylyltransferase